MTKLIVAFRNFANVHKNKSVNAVWGNYGCLFSDPYKIQNAVLVLRGYKFESYVILVRVCVKCTQQWYESGKSSQRLIQTKQRIGKLYQNGRSQLLHVAKVTSAQEPCLSKLPSCKINRNYAPTFESKLQEKAHTAHRLK
jgi:hypothetical protein